MALYGVGGIFFASMGLLFSRAVRKVGYMNPISLFCFAFSAVFFLVPIWLRIENEYLYTTEGYSDTSWIINWAGNIIFGLIVVMTYRFLKGSVFYRRYSEKLFSRSGWRLERFDIKLTGWTAMILTGIAMVIFWTIFRHVSYFELLSNRTKLFSGYGYLLIAFWWPTVFLLTYFVHIVTNYRGNAFRLRLLFGVLPLTLLNSFMWLFLGSRSRGLISILYLLLLHFMLKAKDNAQGRRLLIIAVVGVSVLFAGITLGKVRAHIGSGQGEMPSDIDTTMSSKKLLSGVTIFGAATENNLYLIDNFDYEDVLGGKTLVALVTGLIPRGVWPDKPLGAGPHFINLLYPGSYDLVHGEYLTSYSPGITVEFFMNFHFGGFIMAGVIFGGLLTLLSYVIRYVEDPLKYVLFLFCIEHTFGMLTGEVFGSVAALTGKMSFLGVVYIARALIRTVRDICRTVPLSTSQIDQTKPVR